MQDLGSMGDNSVSCQLPYVLSDDRGGERELEISTSDFTYSFCFSSSLDLAAWFLDTK